DTTEKYIAALKGGVQPTQDIYLTGTYLNINKDEVIAGVAGEMVLPNTSVKISGEFAHRQEENVKGSSVKLGINGKLFNLSTGLSFAQGDSSFVSTYTRLPVDKPDHMEIKATATLDRLLIDNLVLDTAYMIEKPFGSNDISETKISGDLT